MHILQILGCELHKNAFGGRAPPAPVGGGTAHPSPLAVIRRLDRGKGLGIERGKKGRAGKDAKG